MPSPIVRTSRDPRCLAAGRLNFIPRRAIVCPAANFLARAKSRHITLDAPAFDLVDDHQAEGESAIAGVVADLHDVAACQLAALFRGHCCAPSINSTGVATTWRGPG